MEPSKDQSVGEMIEASNPQAPRGAATQPAGTADAAGVPMAEAVALEKQPSPAEGVESDWLIYWLIEAGQSHDLVPPSYVKEHQGDRPIGQVNWTNDPSLALRFRTPEGATSFLRSSGVEGATIHQHWWKGGDYWGMMSPNVAVDSEQKSPLA